MSFKLWEPAVPYNDSRLDSKNISSNLWEAAIACNDNPWFRSWEPGVPTSVNQQLLTMATCGSQVGNQEFQPLGTGNFLHW